jgi:hypothetical protein
MMEVINQAGEVAGYLLLMPFLAYAGLGFASAIFSWLTAVTTPWCHRYLMCLAIGGLLIYAVDA